MSEVYISRNYGYLVERGSNHLGFKVWDRDLGDFVDNCGIQGGVRCTIRQHNKDLESIERKYGIIKATGYNLKCISEFIIDRIERITGPLFDSD